MTNQLPSTPGEPLVTAAEAGRLLDDLAAGRDAASVVGEVLLALVDALTAVATRAAGHGCRCCAANVGDINRLLADAEEPPELALTKPHHDKEDSDG